MVKDTTREKLLALRDKYGTETAIEVARKSLKVKASGGDFKKQFNGEVCEVVLEMILQAMISQKHPDWFYIKGLILPDAESNNHEFLTEIDFVLFTKECVYCIECKSYAGDKTITGKGTINLANGDSRDVYKQNSMHLEVLDKMIKAFSISKRRKYKMLLFNFSSGKCVDLRKVEDARLFPLVDENNFLQKIICSGDTNWDIVGLKEAKPKFEKFSAMTRNKHLQYVKSLHG